MRNSAIDRLYQLLPGYITARDADEGRPLLALMQILTRELELVERDTDQLYDNWFIETCENWAVSYIGDLVGARALREFGEGSLRAYVANTLAYRQAKGTRVILEQLARDVSGWPAVAVEFFSLLQQTRNVNRQKGGVPATMSLRDADTAALTGGPFERAAHSIDVRAIGRSSGRYNIPNLGLFVWRLHNNDLPFLTDEREGGYLGGVVPRVAPHGAGYRLLDPVGRPLRLFNRPRTEQSLEQSSTDASVPGPLRRRRIAADLEALRAGTPGGGLFFRTRPVFAARLGGVSLRPEQLHCCNLADRQQGGGVSWTRPAVAGTINFDPELGRLSLHADDEGKTVEVSYAFGSAGEFGAGPGDRRASVADWIGPFADPEAQPPLWQVGVTRRSEALAGQTIVASLVEAIALWNAEAAPGRRGIIAVLDSASYDEDLSGAAQTIIIPQGAMLAIVAAGWPLRDTAAGPGHRKAGDLIPAGRRPHVASDLKVRGTAKADETGGTLILDGLLLEGRVRVLAGQLGRLELRCGTFGAAAEALGDAVTVTTGNAGLGLRIERSICGRLGLASAAGAIEIVDSVVGEDRVADGNPAAAPVVVDAPAADLAVERSTLFGRSIGRSLAASDSLFTAPLEIARRQAGYVRFSYVPPGSRVPRRFHCAPELQVSEAKERLGAAFTAEMETTIRRSIRPVFSATLAEEPAFGQLALRCPSEIAEGGEGRTEMGALNRLRNPQRLANLRDALSEYLPFGLSADVIFES